MPRLWPRPWRPFGGGGRADLLSMPNPNDSIPNSSFPFRSHFSSRSASWHRRSEYFHGASTWRNNLASECRGRIKTSQFQLAAFCRKSAPASHSSSDAGRLRDNCDFRDLFEGVTLIMVELRSVTFWGLT